jgi:hypothetical protein
MKKLSLVLLTISLFVMSSCGPQIYKAATFEQVRESQKQLAILPFDATLDTKRLPKGITAETVAASNKSTGYSVQSSCYSFFLKEMSKNRYTIDFQDIDKTNSILTKAGISYEDIATKDKAELCQLLGVDGVISGKILMSKPMSEGAAIAVGILVGAWGATNKTDVSMTIHDKKDSKLLWKYDYLAQGSVGSSPEQLARALMRNVSKRFPYKR